MQKKKTTIPIIGAKDKRISLIINGKTVFSDESDDDWNDEYDDDFEEEDDDDDEIEMPQMSKNGNSANPVEAFLKGKSREELVAIIKDIVASYPEVYLELSFKAKLTSPSVAALVKTVSKEIDKATSEPGWSNHWDDSGYIP